MNQSYNIKEIRQLYNLTQEEFAVALGLTRELINKMEKGKCSVSKGTKARIQNFRAERESENFSHEAVVIGQPTMQHASLPYHLQRREQKNIKADVMVPLIGIKAQAGFVKGYEQVDAFVDTLEKYSLPPGVAPSGAEWSYFEIDGDSMEPTFSAGDIILASTVHTEDWQDIKNFGVYVILTANSLVIKRVFKKSAQQWVLISDNEEAYAQKLLPVADIKEVWTFRRHITAKALAPKEFAITV